MTSYDEIKEVQDLAWCETEESRKDIKKIISMKKTSRALKRSIIMSNLSTGFDAIITILIENDVIVVKNSNVKIILVILCALSILYGLNHTASLISEKSINDDKIKDLEKGKSR